jgi:hypothetical protein
MASIFDESQIHLKPKTEKVEIRTCFECEQGCDVNHMEYIKVPELTNKVWVCYECLKTK